MKKSAVPILLIGHLIFPVCQGLAALMEWEFTLASEFCYFLFLTALTVGVTVWVREPGIWGMFLFPVSVIDGLCAIWCTWWLPAAAFAVCWCVCGGILFYRSGRKGVGRISALILTVPLIATLGLSCAVDLFAEVMRSVTVVREVDSPDGTYTARVIDADYGATGGDTLVEVYDNSQTIDLLFGAFTPEAEIGYRGEWGKFDDLEVSWSDDHTLTIEGRTRIILSGEGVIRSIVLTDFDSVTVNETVIEDPEWIGEFLTALKKSRATRYSTIQDYPDEEVMYHIGLGKRDLFLYEKNGTFYIEQPYQGIWEADETLLELLQ